MLLKSRERYSIDTVFDGSGSPKSLALGCINPIK